jgi:hypothetical protein
MTPSFECKFFCDESRSRPALGRRFAAVLEAPFWRLKSATIREWVTNLEALAAGRVAEEERPRVAKLIGAALAGHAAAGPLTHWARAVGLITVLSVIDGTRCAVPNVEPYLDGSGGDLLGPLGQALGRYHDEARSAPAGPLAFFWLAKAAAPLAEHYRGQTTAAVCDYLDRRPADDRVRRFLLPRANQGGDVPALRDGTWAEWVCGLFNGQRHAWTRDGTFRAGALLLIAAVAAAALGAWAVADARVQAWRAAQIEPMQRALSR